MPVMRSAKIYDPEGLTVRQLLELAEDCKWRHIDPNAVLVGKTTILKARLIEIKVEGAEVIEDDPRSDS